MVRRIFVTLIGLALWTTACSSGSDPTSTTPPPSAPSNAADQSTGDDDGQNSDSNLAGALTDATGVERSETVELLDPTDPASWFQATGAGSFVITGSVNLVPTGDSEPYWQMDVRREQQQEPAAVRVLWALAGDAPQLMILEMTGPLDEDGAVELVSWPPFDEMSWAVVRGAAREPAGMAALGLINSSDPLVTESRIISPDSFAPGDVDTVNGVEAVIQPLTDIGSAVQVWNRLVGTIGPNLDESFVDTMEGTLWRTASGLVVRIELRMEVNLEGTPMLATALVELQDIGVPLNLTP